MYSIKHVDTIIIVMLLSSMAYADPLLDTAPPVPMNLTGINKKVDDAMLNDPTKPPDIGSDKKSGTNGESSKVQSIDVQIISYQPDGGSFVVINGHRFIEGDVFDDSTIKKIEKNKVILANPDRKPLVLEYAKLSIKKNEGRLQ